MRLNGFVVIGLISLLNGYIALFLACMLFFMFDNDFCERCEKEKQEKAERAEREAKKLKKIKKDRR